VTLYYSFVTRQRMEDGWKNRKMDGIGWC
jgi:hypothetical protein